MFKRNFYICLLVAAGVLIAGSLFGQQTATFDYSTLTGGVVIVGGDYDPSTKVCPSQTGCPSLRNYQVKVNISDYVTIANTTFEWVVYGGYITALNGTPVAGSHEVYSGVRFSQASASGIANPSEPDPNNWIATVTVEWDTLNFSSINGWVAVRQTSEWGCSDDRWSVFRNLVQNTPPVFTTFPQNNIHIPYDRRNSYSLPVPAVTDDGCNVLPCTTTMTVTVENPIGTVYFTGSNTLNTVNLLSGTNFITWTLFDGSRTTRQSYNLIVEPAFEILHAAWLNPWGGLDNGSILVTGITPGLTGSIEYNFDGNGWAAASSATGLATGAHTIDARITYNVDIDSDGDIDETLTQNAVTQYSYTLHAMSATAINAVPAEGPNAVVKDVSCLSSTDGKIDIIDESLLIEQNSSVSFNGDDYLLLNKKYSAPINRFSVSAWIKVPAGGNTEGTILSFDNNEFYQLSLLYWTTSGVARVRFQSTSSGGLDNEMFFHSKPVNDNKWHFIVATYDNGQHVLYVDGERQAQTGTYGTSVGSNTPADARYGMIGARSATADFIADPQGPFFTGQIAEVAIWDNMVLDQAAVTLAMKMGATGMGDRWVLNDIPANISATQSGVFTDLGNNVTPANWGRFYNGALSANNSPKLYSYTDSKGGGIGIYPSTADQINLGEATYTMHVRDVYGRGETTGPYVVQNSDALPPEIYWSASAGKTASQSGTTGTNAAALAIDGFAANASQTAPQLEAWWEVDLGGIFPIRAVDIHPHTDFGNFWVITSQTPFTVGSTLAQDLAVSGAVSVQYVGTTNGSTSIMISSLARYVRIRAAGTISLYLNEVEVFTNQATTPVRTLYLGNACNYTIAAGEYSINPKVYDSCNGITSFTNDRNETGTLAGQVFTLGDNTVTWTATDDRPSTTTKDIIYRVVDNTNPVINPLPFGNGNATITYCQSLAYSLLIPKITDNYTVNTCGPLTSIELFSYINGNPFRAFNFDPISSYDPATDQYTGDLDYNDFLPEGDIVLEWRVRDHNWNALTPAQNVATDRLNLHVQRQPRVLEVKVSPITCNGSDNAQVTFTRIRSEKDIVPATVVTYILKSTVDPYPEITQDDNNVFNGVDPGIYQALIEVNGCRSLPYFNLINIVNPGPIAATAEVTPVRCSGWDDGAIVPTVTGGSQTDILHFFGNEENSASSTYAALNLGETGTIEGWIYLDSLISGDGINDDAGLFGVYNATDGYGFRMVNSVLTFYAGSHSVSAAAGAIAERQWYHISGTWSGSTGNISLSVYGGATVTAAGIPAGFTVPTGGNGTLYFGDLINGDGVSNNLHGFVRNVRIWDRVLTSTEITNNLYLLDPIDISYDMVANFPVAAGGGTTLQNRSPGGSQGTVSATNYTWQRFAYTWANSSGTRISNHKDLVDVVADNYTVTIQDPIGCNGSATFGITIKDTDQPNLTFSNNGYHVEPYLTAGELIRRNTNATTGDVRNVIGDCLYYPSAMEFNPYIDDGECPAGDVEVEFEILSGAFGDAGYVSDFETLDGAPMTDEMTLRWTATDRAGNSRPVEVTYHIIDNEAPVLSWSNQIRQTDENDCGYTVTAADLAMNPTVTENCTTGRLFNNLNGLNNLNGYRFEGGTTTPVIWTYEDKSFGIGYEGGVVSVTYNVTVEDDQEPDVECYPTTRTVQLDGTGHYTLNSLEIDNGSDDNCGALTALNVTRNIAYNSANVSLSSYDNTGCFADNIANALESVDGVNTSGSCNSSVTTSQTNPYWEINLGLSNTIYGIRIFADDNIPLNNFWILVSDDGSYCATPPCDLNTPAWNGHVTYSQYYTGPELNGGARTEISFPRAVTGQYLRIWMNSPAGVLSLTEVEVYGTTTPAASTSLALDCNDVRYTPAPDIGTPGVRDDAKGTFRVNGFMLTAIDNDGNAASCIAGVQVEDNIQPTVIPEGVPVILESNGQANLNNFLEEIDNGSNDACGLIDRWISPETVSCGDVGNFNARLYARDNYGNSKWEPVTVIVTDDTKPKIRRFATVNLDLNSDGYLDVNPLVHIEGTDPLINQSTDNCGIASRVTNPVRVTCDDIRLAGDIRPPVSITYRVTDVNGNVEDSTFVVVVRDRLSPTATYNEYTCIVDETNRGLIRFEDIIPPLNMRDNCDDYNEISKWISYDNGVSWCNAGQEGTGAEPAFVDITNLVSNVGGSTAYSGYPLLNCKDGSKNNAYITDVNINDRTVTYTFPQDYEINSASIAWEYKLDFPTSRIIVNPNDYRTGGYNTSTALTGYLASNLDNLNANPYITDSYENYRQFCYNLNAGYYVTTFTIDWTGPRDLNSDGDANDIQDCGYPDQLVVYYVDMNGDLIQFSNWVTVSGSSTTIGLSRQVRGILIYLYRDRGNWPSYSRRRRIGVNEWTINGVSMSSSCDLPRNATLEWWNGTGWAAMPSPSGSLVGTTAGEYNILNFNTVTTSQLRVTFNRSGWSDRRIGIQEFAVKGRVPYGGGGISSPCTYFDCGDDDTNVPVILRWEDKSGNPGSYNTTVLVHPYFNVTDVIVKDCGVMGEYYSFDIENESAFLNYD